MFIGEALAAEAKKEGAGTETSVGMNDAGSVPYELSGEKMLTDTLVFLVLLFGIFYFLLIRPQQRRIREHDSMLGAIKKGSRIVTGGGVIGTVTKTEGDDIVVVEIAQNVRVRVARATIAEVLKDDAMKGETANDN
jgi:preprotein translocase subunit YajC